MSSDNPKSDINEFVFNIKIRELDFVNHLLKTQALTKFMSLEDNRFLKEAAFCIRLMEEFKAIVMIFNKYGSHIRFWSMMRN